MNILIGADIVPQPSNIDLFINGKISTIVGEELLKVINDVDYRIYNLETPLTEKKNPIHKCGPNFSVTPQVVNGLKALKTDLLTLANNHIMDQGSEGLSDTISALKKNDISFVGVGDNKKEASKPYIIEKSDMKIGVYACVEHEFSGATEKKSGANVIDLLYCMDHISELKKQCDWVIILYHGMKEYYRYPTPELQRVMHRMIDKGADLIVCQHSHCIGCEEQYNEGKIVYGQGNFIFTAYNNEYWNSGMLLKLRLEKHDFSIEYIPYVRKDESSIRLANEIEKKELIDAYLRRSELIKKEEFVNEEFNRHTEILMRGYLQNMLGKIGHNFIFRVINRLLDGKFVYKFYDKSRLLSILNYVECEAHNEFLKNGLRIEIEERKR